MSSMAVAKDETKEKEKKEEKRDEQKKNKEKKRYKVTNFLELHHGFQYHDDGLHYIGDQNGQRFNNDASQPEGPGRLYHTELKNLPDWLNWGVWVREVRLPTEKEIKEFAFQRSQGGITFPYYLPSLESVKSTNKVGSNYLIFDSEKKWSLFNFKTWEMLADEEEEQENGKSSRPFLAELDRRQSSYDLKQEILQTAYQNWRKKIFEIIFNDLQKTEGADKDTARKIVSFLKRDYLDVFLQYVEYSDTQFRRIIVDSVKKANDSKVREDQALAKVDSTNKSCASLSAERQQQLAKEVRDHQETKAKLHNDQAFYRRELEEARKKRNSWFSIEEVILGSVAIISLACVFGKK